LPAVTRLSGSPAKTSDRVNKESGRLPEVRGQPLFCEGRITLYRYRLGSVGMQVDHRAREPVLWKDVVQHKPAVSTRSQCVIGVEIIGKYHPNVVDMRWCKVNHGQDRFRRIAGPSERGRCGLRTFYNYALHSYPPCWDALRCSLPLYAQRSNFGSFYPASDSIVMFCAIKAGTPIIRFSKVH